MWHPAFHPADQPTIDERYLDIAEGHGVCAVCGHDIEPGQRIYRYLICEAQEHACPQSCGPVPTMQELWWDPWQMTEEEAETFYRQRFALGHDVPPKYMRRPLLQRLWDYRRALRRSRLGIPRHERHERMRRALSLYRERMAGAA